MIHVVIADDHPLIRKGIRQLLFREADMELTGEFADAKDLLHGLDEIECDVLILDISLPDRNGLDVLQRIKERWPHIRVLVLSMHPEERYALRALRAGADGYIPKETDVNKLLQAVRKVSAGRRYVSEPVGEKLAGAYVKKSELLPHEQLTQREFQILLMIGRGMSVNQISDHLSISMNTVYTYRSRILNKMSLSTNSGLIRYALQYKLID